MIFTRVKFVMESVKNSLARNRCRIPDVQEQHCSAFTVNVPKNNTYKPIKHLLGWPSSPLHQILDSALKNDENALGTGTTNTSSVPFTVTLVLVWPVLPSVCASFRCPPPRRRAPRRQVDPCRLRRPFEENELSKISFAATLYCLALCHRCGPSLICPSPLLSPSLPRISLHV